METYKSLYIIGSSHISKQSINEIKKAFEEIAPDIVAVELDNNRIHALFAKKQGKPSIYDIKRVGLKGFIFALIGSWASKKLGKIVGVSPGDEMKTAITMAKEKNLKVALIDQDIEITLKRFSKSLSWKERWNFVADIFNAVVLRKKEPLLNFDLSKVPDNKLIEMMISKLKQRYPNIYKVLIEERNYFMARKLKNLLSNYPDKKILAVMGAGHVTEILKILKENEGVTYSFSVSQ